MPIPASGQTTMHLHVHVMPYRGSRDDPAGGVRGVIPRETRPHFVPNTLPEGTAYSG